MVKTVVIVVLAVIAVAAIYVVVILFAFIKCLVQAFHDGWRR